MSSLEKFNRICERFYVPFSLVIDMEKENVSQKEKADILEYMAYSGQLEKKRNEIKPL